MDCTNEVLRIGVMSDTHGSLDRVKQVVCAAGDVCAWFHCGDFAADAKVLEHMTNKPVYAVHGNCDFMPVAPSHMIVEIGGKRFYLTHGYLENVSVANGYTTLLHNALKNNCDMAVFGHTHISSIEYSNAILLNPGSPTKPLGGQTPSYAIITVCADKLNAQICTLNR